MKALTLWQPWATLIALGEKQYETRHWPTDHRGQLAIHASKNISQIRLCEQEPFISVLYEHGSPLTDLLTIAPSLPLGAVLCIVELVDVFPVEEIWGDLSEQERAFGNFSPGRFAWELQVADVFPRPIPARGQQGLWEWNFD